MILLWLQRRDPRQIGIVGIAIVAVIGTLVVALSVMPFGRNVYTAYFEHTAGLRVGEEVQVAGVGVGDVTGIHLDGDQVAVTFTISKDVDLGPDTRAEVKIATLLGSHYLEISPGGDGDLPDDTIPVAQTTVPFNLQDVIEGAGDTLPQYQIDRIADSMEVLSEVLDTAPDHLRPALDGVLDLTDLVVNRSDQIAQLLEAASILADDLNASSDGVFELMEQTNLALGELIARRAVIRAVLRDARTLTEHISGAIEDNEDRFGDVLDDFGRMVDLFDEYDAELTASIQGMALMAHYFSNASGTGPWIDLDVWDLAPDAAWCFLPQNAGECE